MPRNLTITARGESFRRAGIRFSGGGTVVDLDTLSLDQLRELRDEPLLAMEREALAALIVELEAAEAAAAESKKGTKKAKSEGEAK